MTVLLGFLPMLEGFYPSVRDVQAFRRARHALAGGAVKEREMRLAGF